MEQLKDKVILVTGATSGIGKAIAEICARDGANVIVTATNHEKSVALAKKLPSNGTKHFGLKLDVSSEADQKAAFDAIIEKYGAIDGLVNNAGIDFGKPLLSTTSTEWMTVLDINLNGMFFLTQKFLAHSMEKKQNGVIVNISSVHSLSTYEGSGSYAASKAAMHGLTRSIACEFGKYGIRANCVAPGLVKTRIWKDLVMGFGGNEKECLDYWKKQIPIERIIHPEEIGEIVSFVLSDRASCLNGSIIYADGGLTSQLISRQ